MKTISPIKGSGIFALFTAYFCFLLYCVLPLIKSRLTFSNSVTYWLVIGYLLFSALFLCAIFSAKREGNKNLQNILSALSVKKFSEEDWKYSFLGLLAVIIFSGMIFGGAILLNKFFGIPMLETKVWFIEVQPVSGKGALILLLWLPMFLLNIFGEELLWRGYIQSRLKNKNLWFVYALMWLIFHIPFGLSLLIMLIPIIIIIPYVFSKRDNTLIGCFIHGLFNGPIFVLILLGIIK